jgi:DNA polymerase-3 subunit alpha
MKRYLKQLKPTLFSDLIAMNALYRPGPMQFIDEFIERKHGRKTVTYEHPKLKAVLESTYGVLVYQEQFMQVSKDMCGFTGGQADTLRKAIGKKQRDTMKKMKAAFVEGMVKHSDVKPAFAESFWARMEAFADYGFNKVHAACYATIAYQTAWLKANYPEAYMAALMTSDYDDTDRLAIEITECKRMGITVLPPDVNQSFVEFAVVPGEKQIRFGLAAIKNVGTGVVEEILRARGKEGFASLEDFLARVSNRVVNRKPMESLIKAGAFDRYGDRTTLLHNLDFLLAYASRLQKQADSGQTDIFGNLEEGGSERPPLELQPAGAPGDQRQQLLWERDRVVLVRGKISTRDRSGNGGGEVKVMVDDAREITSQQASGYQGTGKKAKTPKPRAVKAKKPDAAPRLNERLYIRLQNTSDEETLLSLKQTIDHHQGSTEVVLVLGEASAKQAIKLPGGIDRESDGLAKLRELVGTDNLVIQ